LQAVGSAAVIASYAARNPLVERKELEHLAKRVDCAAAKERALSHKIDEIIIAVAKPIWPKHPSYTSWRVAGEILNTVNERLPKGLHPLKQDAVYKRLERLKHRILS
jgi:hypothetical protein